jgi:predicted RNase H-like nuclease (RuvC/YqgF family)
MTENIDNLILEHLRHIRGKVDKTEQSIEDLKIRMSRLESAMLSVKREVADSFEHEIHQQSTNDRIIERLERIERRLEIQDI